MPHTAQRKPKKYTDGLNLNPDRLKIAKEESEKAIKVTNTFF